VGFKVEHRSGYFTGSTDDPAQLIVLARLIDVKARGDHYAWLAVNDGYEVRVGDVVRIEFDAEWQSW
jgi:hypothetical protein